MGSGTSLPATLDKEAARLVAGDRFDEDAFDVIAKDGEITREQFRAAAGIEATAGEPAVASATAASSSRQAESVQGAAASEDGPAPSAETAAAEARLLDLKSDVLLHVLGMLPPSAAAAAAASSIQMASLLRPIIATAKARRAAAAERRLGALLHGSEPPFEDDKYLSLRRPFEMFAVVEDGSGREVIKRSALQSLLKDIGMGRLSEAQLREMLREVDACRMPGESSMISFRQLLAAMAKREREDELECDLEGALEELEGELAAGLDAPTLDETPGTALEEDVGIAAEETPRTARRLSDCAADLTALHEGGEESRVQAVLESCGVASVGSRQRVMQLVRRAVDAKHLLNEQLARGEVPTR